MKHLLLTAALLILLAITPAFAQQSMTDVMYGQPEVQNAMLGPVVAPENNRSHVSAVQHELRSRGYKIGVDGKYGPKTRAAVKKFQRRNGLRADGVLGAQTLAALGLTSIH